MCIKRLFCTFTLILVMKYNPIFQQEITECLQKFRGMGLLRAHTNWFESKLQFRIMPADRSHLSPTYMVIIQLAYLDGDSWYYQPEKPRHRFFRKDFSSCADWLQHAITLSNGVQAFAHTQAK
jgi:hypothetical protein